MNNNDEYTIARVIIDRPRRLGHVILADGGLWRSLPLGFAQRERLVGKRLTNIELNDLLERSKEWQSERKAKKTERHEQWQQQKPTSGNVTDVRIHRGRAYIYLEGSRRSSFSLDPQLAEREGVEPGAQVDPVRLQTLEQEDQLLLAQNKIDDLTSRRPRSVAEMRTRLTRAGWGEQIAAQAIARAIDYGNLNDAAFVDWFIASRGAIDGKGWYHIQRELSYRFGIDPELIAAAASKFAGDEALTTAIRRASSGLNLAERNDQRRFTDRLARRGFSFAEARGAIERMKTESE